MSGCCHFFIKTLLLVSRICFQWKFSHNCVLGRDFCTKQRSLGTRCGLKHGATHKSVLEFIDDVFPGRWASHRQAVRNIFYWGVTGMLGPPYALSCTNMLQRNPPSKWHRIRQISLQDVTLLQQASPANPELLIQYVSRKIAVTVNFHPLEDPAEERKSIAFHYLSYLGSAKS